MQQISEKRTDRLSGWWKLPCMAFFTLCVSVCSRAAATFRTDWIWHQLNPNSHLFIGIHMTVMSLLVQESQHPSRKKNNSCTTSEQRSRESNGVCVCTMSSYLPLSRSSASLSPHVPDPALSGRKTILNKPNSAQTIFPSCLAEAILTINVFA